MNTFLLVSETNYFIENKLEELKDGIDNIVTFNMDINTINEVLEEASYASMFNDNKCIIVKNTKNFSASKSGDTNKSKDDNQKILNYLANENPHTRLIFISKNGIDNKKKIVNIFKENNNLFIYPNIKKTEIKNELKKIAESKKFQVDDQSLWHIVNSSLGDLDLAVNELNKIMNYYEKPTKILYQDVYNLTAKTLKDNNFKLVDAIISRDLDSTFIALEEAKRLKIEPYSILNLLYREYKLMLSTILLEENKYLEKDILKELKLADWQFKKVKNNLYNYSKEEIKNIIIKLSDLDYQIKSGLIDKDVVLINFILNLNM